VSAIEHRKKSVTLGRNLTCDQQQSVDKINVRRLRLESPLLPERDLILDQGQLETQIPYSFRHCLRKIAICNHMMDRSNVNDLRQASSIKLG
jgi:hypothetical protein